MSIVGLAASPPSIDRRPSDESRHCRPQLIDRHAHGQVPVCSRLPCSFAPQPRETKLIDVGGLRLNRFQPRRTGSGERAKGSGTASWSCPHVTLPAAPLVAGAGVRVLSEGAHCGTVGVPLRLLLPPSSLSASTCCPLTPQQTAPPTPQPPPKAARTREPRRQPPPKAARTREPRRRRHHA